MRRTVAVLAVMMTMAVMSACDLGSEEEKKKLRPVDAGLAPKRALTVKDFRFVDACRALPVAAVEKAFGTMGQFGRFRAEYRSAVTREESGELGEDSLSSSCDYSFDDDQKQQVKVTLDEFASQKAARKSWAFAASVGNGGLDRYLDGLAKKVGGSGSVSSKKMLKALRGSAEYLKERGKGIAPLEGAGDAVLYNPSRSEFIALRRNVVVTLTYKFGTTDPFDPKRKVAPQEVSSVLGSVRTALDTIHASIDDDDLSQAPVRTVLSKATTAHSGRLLEPCAVLTPKIFEQVMGTADHPSHQFTSGPRDASLTSTSTHLTSPTCERRVNTPDQKGNFDIELFHLASASDATRMMESCDSGHELTELTVKKAKKAVRCTDPEDALNDTGGFASGPYYVKIWISRGSVFRAKSAKDEEWAKAVDLLATQVASFR